MSGISSMTDLNQVAAAGSALTAGGLLKQARQAKGLHIAALAASIKVAQRKLELLEADRFTELPDATFTRALAQTVCRSLKIDAAPVLALMPAASGGRLDQMGEGINAPFRERPGRSEPTDWGRLVASPAVWGPALVLLAALCVYFLPSSLFSGLQLKSSPTAAKVSAAAAVPFEDAAASNAAAVPAPALEAVAVPAAAAPPLAGAVETVFSAPPLAQAASIAATGPATSLTTLSTTNANANVTANPAAPSNPGAVGAGGILQLRASAESWVEVQDAKQQVLLSRMLIAGETVRLDGELPLRLKVGNAPVTEVVFRGQAVSLVPTTVGNIARLELK